MADAFASISPAVDEYGYVPDFDEEETYWREQESNAGSPFLYSYGSSTVRKEKEVETKGNKKVISPTGSFQLHIRNHKVLAMVDSSAEMNMD